MGIWLNRAGKAAILLTVAGVVGATGYLAGNGAAAPEPVAEKLPEPDFEPRVIKVGEGTIVSRLVLDATVQADPAVGVRPEKGGEVTAVHVKSGDKVTKGQTLLTFKYRPPQADPKKKPPKAQTLYLTASAAGEIKSVNAHVGTPVSPGEPAFTIDRGLFRAVAAVESKNVYKLYNKPESIKLQIDHGPAPFACRLLDYGAGSGGAEGGAEVKVTCRIPLGKRVFAGLPGKMSILTDKAADVPVVPLSAVLGQSGTGYVTVVVDGKRERRKVKLGLNDGKQVEIRDGLEVGERILDRAPEDAAFSGPDDGAKAEGGQIEGGPLVIEQVP
ncbi:HlyD family efflux transporter periplasmic adaptor subunit [Actinocorallia aurea]